MARQKISIKLKGYDNRLLDTVVKQLIRSIRDTGSQYRGPIPLPRRIFKFDVNKSPHVDKKSREQFEIRNHVRLLVIDSPTPETTDALAKVDIPSGIDVGLKM